jgi:hypothetical protein
MAGLLFRQEKEMRRLRATIAELTAKENPAASTLPNPPADFEELHRAAAEIQNVRAEIAQLRREQVDTTALQARIDKLALDVATIVRILDRKPNYSRDSDESRLPPQVTQSSPEEAARWVASLPPGKEQEQAALAVLDRWRSSDPAAAAAWTTKFAEGPLREEAMSAVARHWGLHDQKAAAAWLETLPAGASRDAAIGAFVTSADGYDIKLALEWANQMEASETRAERVEETARRWLREDNAAARAWIEKAQLPSGMAERLLSAK